MGQTHRLAETATFVEPAPDVRPRILVVGDAMLDCYWEGVVERISPEAPVPVLQITRQFDRAGGAANVAANLATLGAQVGLLTVLGADAAADRLSQSLKAHDIAVHAVVDPAYRTTQKIRCVSQRHQMLRADVEDKPSREALHSLASRYEALVDDYDLIVLSDYGKGVLQEAARLIHRATQNGIPTLVDPKGTDYRRYRGATLVKPNLQEFKAVAGAFDSPRDFSRRADRLRRQLGLTHLLVTMGDSGMTLFNDGGARHVPAHRREVYDVSGAGDTVLATLAFILTLGQPIDEAVKWANVAGSLVVGKFGTSTLSWQELSAAADDLMRGAGPQGSGHEPSAAALAPWRPATPITGVTAP